MCDFVPTVRTEGVIEVAGRDIFSGDANELRVRVGMVFQHPNPFPMSIRDNILYGPRRMRRLGRAEADELVERCLRDAGLWDEAWVETAPVVLGAGVKAPAVPGVLTGTEQRHGHLLETWKQKA